MELKNSSHILIIKNKKGAKKLNSIDFLPLFIPINKINSVKIHLIIFQ